MVGFGIFIGILLFFGGNSSNISERVPGPFMYGVMKKALQFDKLRAQKDDEDLDSFYRTMGNFDFF